MERLSGRDLEDLVVERAGEYKARKLAHVSRCGVQAVRIGNATGQADSPLWQVLKSLPDFEGVNAQGLQFIFDCKVCSQASFDLTKYRSETKGSKSRQLKHMLERSCFQVPCFFLMHWNERELKTFAKPCVTYLFPICESMEFWQAFQRGEIRSITRSHCEEYGTVVDWNMYGQGRKPRPDFLAGINEHLLKQVGA